MRLLFLALAFCVAAQSDARACVTCATGDPSLTTMGNGAWRSRTWRLQTSLRLRGFQAADVHIDERRLGLAVQYAPHERLAFMARQYVAHQTIRGMNLAEERRYVFSDPWLGARFVLFRDGRFAPAHLLSLEAGLTLPIVDGRASAFGRVGRDAQLTGHRIEAGGGLSYRFRRGKSAVLARVSLRSGDDPVLLSQLRVSYQPAESVSFVAASAFQRVLHTPSDTMVTGSFGFRVRAGDSTLGVEVAVPLYMHLAEGGAGPILMLDWVLDV